MHRLGAKAAGAAILIAAASPVAAGDIDDLGWLVGAWETAARGSVKRWTEERWGPPRAGVMLGTSISGRADRMSEYEFFRLAPDEQGILTYWASPNGRSPVPFRMVALEEGKVVFENPAHDYPTRIVYQRTTDGMTATISGPNGANSMSWRHKRVAP
jgi:hypothetical protein